MGCVRGPATGALGVAYQLRRVRALGVEGVSLATWVLFAYMEFASGSPTAFAARSVRNRLGQWRSCCLPMQLAILFRLSPWRRWVVPVRALGYFTVCCVVPTLLWGWAGGVFGTGVAMTINRAPQLIELVRQVNASGVSATSWFVAFVGCSLWIVYYSGAHLWAALTATAFARVSPTWPSRYSHRRPQLEARRRSESLARGLPVSV